MLEETGRYRYPVPSQSWLGRRSEAIIEPDLPIVDPHHHLWEHGAPYLDDEIVADVSSGHTIAATVFVQCYYGYDTSGPEALRPVGETRRIVTIAEAVSTRTPSRVAAGIVAFGDLRRGAEVEMLLDSHAAAAGRRFVGLRQTTARDALFPEGIVTRPAPKGMMAEGAFRDGVRRLARRNLSFDAMIYHRQIGELADLARAAPDTRIVLDHVGCPLGIALTRRRHPTCSTTGRESFAAWRNARMSGSSSEGSG